MRRQRSSAVNQPIRSRSAAPGDSRGTRPARASSGRQTVAQNVIAVTQPVTSPRFYCFPAVCQHRRGFSRGNRLGNAVALLCWQRPHFGRRHSARLLRRSVSGPAVRSPSIRRHFDTQIYGQHPPRFGNTSGNHQARAGLSRASRGAVDARAMAPHRPARRNGAANPVLVRHCSGHFPEQARHHAVGIQRRLPSTARRRDDARAVVRGRRAGGHGERIPGRAERLLQPDSGRPRRGGPADLQPRSAVSRGRPAPDDRPHRALPLCPDRPRARGARRRRHRGEPHLHHRQHRGGRAAVELPAQRRAAAHCRAWPSARHHAPAGELGPPDR